MDSIEAQSSSLGLGSSLVLLIPPSNMLKAELTSGALGSGEAYLFAPSYLYVFTHDTTETFLTSYSADFLIQKILPAEPAQVSLLSPEAVLRISNGIAVASPSSLTLAGSPGQLRYKPLGLYPSLRPTTRQFSVPQLPVSRVRSVNYKATRTLIANRLGKGKLSLTYENISDTEAAQLFQSYEDCYGSFKPFLLPDNALSGVDESLKRYMNVYVTNRPLRPGDFLRMPAAVCASGVGAEYRWMRNGEIIGGHESNYYVLDSPISFGDGTTTVIQGMYRCSNQSNWTVSNPYSDTPVAMGWRWSRPPALRSKSKGVSTVDVELQAETIHIQPSFDLIANCAFPLDLLGGGGSGSNPPAIPGFPLEVEYEFFHEAYDFSYFFLPPSFIGGGGGSTSIGWKPAVQTVEYTTEPSGFRKAASYYIDKTTKLRVYTGEMSFVPPPTPKLRVTKARYRVSPVFPWTEFGYDGSYG